MSIERSPALDSILCITVDNSPIVGRYLEDPGLLSSDTLTEPSVLRPYSYRYSGTSIVTVRSTTAAPTAYSPGTPIVAAFTVTSGGSTLRSAYGGIWNIPGPQYDHSCSYDGNGNNVRFRYDLPVQQCTESILLSSTSCEAFSADRLITNLRIGTDPSSLPSIPTTWTNITIGTVSLIDPSSGAIKIGSVNDLTSNWDSTSCTCSGAVVGIAYQVMYTATTGIITSVTADVVIATYLNQSSTLCGKEPVTIPVSSSVIFIANTQPANGVSYGSSNAARYDRSGSPGYRWNAPLLGGVLIAESGINPLTNTPSATDRVAIARSAPPGLLSLFSRVDTTGGSHLNGLSVRGPSPNGYCVMNPTGNGKDSALPIGVNFGEDLSISCSMNLNVNELANLCATPANVPKYFGLGSMNTSYSGTLNTISHIGIYGNSDPWKVWQWLKLDAPTPSTSAVWDATKQTCTGIVTGIDIEFLYAAVGSAENPQYKIISSRIMYPTETWTFSREDIRTHTPVAKQTFLFRTTVTYTEYKAAADPLLIAPAPPVIPKIPSDLWYPFDTADASATAYLTTSNAVPITVAYPFVIMISLISTVVLMVRG